MGKTKVDSHSWKTRITSGVSLIAAGTLESRNTAMRGMEWNRQKMKGKICLSIQIAESCHLFLLFIFFSFPLLTQDVHNFHSTGATQAVKATVTVSRQYLLKLF